MVLTATTGAIGNIVNGAINYIYVENPGTISANAHGNIWISEGDLGLDFVLDMNVKSIISSTGNVTLRAGQSILGRHRQPQRRAGHRRQHHPDGAVRRHRCGRRPAGPRQQTPPSPTC